MLYLSKIINIYSFPTVVSCFFWLWRRLLTDHSQHPSFTGNPAPQWPPWHGQVVVFTASSQGYADQDGWIVVEKHSWLNPLKKNHFATEDTLEQLYLDGFCLFFGGCSHQSSEFQEPWRWKSACLERQVLDKLDPERRCISTRLYRWSLIHSNIIKIWISRLGLFSNDISYTFLYVIYK